MNFPVRARDVLVACAIGSLAYLACMPAVAGPANVEKATIDPACAKPAYPRGALRGGQEGTVRLALLVGADGDVHESSVLASTGYLALDSAAQEAVGRCTFAPKVVKGKAVDSNVDYEYTFRPEGEAPGESKPAPPPPAFEAAPAHLRAFLIAARKADTIVGPLKRCLAYPDLPGNHWPPGMVQAYCEVLLERAMTLKQAAAMVDRGAFSELDALYRRDLNRHFSKGKVSEVIHADLGVFDGSDESARVSSLWVEKAPESAFANAARGAYFFALVGRERGSEAMKDTPQANLDRMSAVAAQVYRYLGKAVRLEPRMIAAHVATMQIAMVDGKEVLREEAFKRAQALDPGCRALVMARMAALSPRWGGRDGAMERYAVELQPLVRARPLLAISQLYPVSEAGFYALMANANAEGIAMTSKAALAMPFTSMLEMWGLHSAFSGGDPWEALVILLEASRFSSNDLRAARERGRQLFNIGERDWALASLKRAVALAPDDANANFLLGKLYFELRDFELAEPHLVKGLRDEFGHRDVLHMLYKVADHEGNVDKADKYISQYTGEYPQEVDSWWELASIKRVQGKENDAVDAYKKYLALSDDSNPARKRGRGFAQRYIDGKRE